jgi:hypothetical protein
MVLTVFGIVLPWMILGVGCWIGYHLMRQNGRLLLRLVPALHPVPRVASSPAQGLPLGSVAPEFALPDLAGGAAPHTLAVAGATPATEQGLLSWQKYRLLYPFFPPVPRGGLIPQ